MRFANDVNPLVTIGCMTYNQMRFLDKSFLINALESFVNQTYSNKEILIYDDHSEDGTYEICLEYAKKYPFIKLHRNDKNIGVMLNFERLLNSVGGDYFLWGCPDDIYAKDFIEKTVDRFKQNSHASLVCAAVKVTYSGGDVRHFYYRDFLRKLPFRKIVRNVLRGVDALGNSVHYPPLIHSSLIRFDLIDKIYNVDQLFIIEEAWFLNALIWGSIDYIDEILYYRYALEISNRIKLMKEGEKISGVFNNIKYLFIYLRHFLSLPSVKFSKKIQYFHIFFIALKIRIYPRIKGSVKVFVLNNILRKLGFMRYEDKL